MNQSEFLKEVELLGITLNNTQLEQLEEYYNLLTEYNKVMNLTAITKKEDVYLKHFYDSLTLLKIVDLSHENTLCDLGSGAGFPGIVLKIVFPNLKITLVDSLNKRINFLNIVINKLKLKDIEAVHYRIEDFSRENCEKYDIVTARAVAPLNILLELGINLVRMNKHFVSMKGNLDNELSYSNCISKLGIKEVSKIEFELPKENSKRTLIKFEKISQTPKIFPRKYSDIKRRPL